jgi:hypothetical protein
LMQPVTACNEDPAIGKQGCSVIQPLAVHAGCNRKDSVCRIVKFAR